MGGWLSMAWFVPLILSVFSTSLRPSLSARIQKRTQQRMQHRIRVSGCDQNGMDAARQLCGRRLCVGCCAGCSMGCCGVGCGCELAALFVKTARALPRLQTRPIKVDDIAAAIAHAGHLSPRLEIARGGALDDD